MNAFLGSVRFFACFLFVPATTSWVLAPSLIPSFASRTKYEYGSPIVASSTPFEAGFYDDGNPYSAPSADESSLAVAPDTRLVIGLNKYSHDASICAADAKTGQVLFALSKERLTRRKHDSGNTAILVDACLKSLNHHHRILPLEANPRHMEWESALRMNGGAEAGYDEPENLFPGVPHRQELSHHLAHAYSTAAQAPFASGLCVVMDGMGETFRTMQRAMSDPSYTSDLSFGLDSFQTLPGDIAQQAATSYFDWREAESVYIFTKTEDAIDLRPVFKRFTPENSPPVLFNHGFENMDSVGAVYSRASTHIFGDWNACGKVMGLAPWANHVWNDGTSGSQLRPQLLSTPILTGSLFTPDFAIDRSIMQGVPHIARNDPDLFADDGSQRERYDFDDYDSNETNESGDANMDQRLPAAVALDAIALAHRVQMDLETVVLDFVRVCKETTGVTNLCLAGGVALNSVLNGRLARELGFEQTFVSPYPGDDGIAVGCCAFGLFGNPRLEGSRKSLSPPVWQRYLSPYLGPSPSEEDITRAIDTALPWLDVETIRDEDQRLQLMVEAVESGAVVAWYRSRSETGPRALGHRSILADPRKKGLVRFINENVKGRECFRPFAPSVLADEAANWFDLGVPLLGESGNVSPFMSVTASVREDKRAVIPAVTHVDGTSRIQTVTLEDEPMFYKMIAKFFKQTGVPMVLNTSFNTLPSEPIVETPDDAIRSFLCSMGAIEVLVMGDFVIRRKQPDLRRLLGEADSDGAVRVEPAFPFRAGPVSFESSFELDAGPTDESDVVTNTRVSMPSRPMHSGSTEWFELLDELEGEVLSVCDGTVTLNDILSQYTVYQDEMGAVPDMEANQNMLQNIVHRLVRLYEHTLVGW
jgi:predicted NodU family carbamoyl transferase